MTSSLPFSAAAFAGSFALLPPDDAQGAVLHNERVSRTTRRIHQKIHAP